MDTKSVETTLQSVIDHCNEPDLVAQARARLATITESEVQQTAPSTPQDQEITMPGGDNNGKKP